MQFHPFSFCVQLTISLHQLVHSFLFLGLDTREAVYTLFPSDFHTALRTLLAKLLLARMSEWKEVLLNSSVGPAKLVDFGKTRAAHTDRGRSRPCGSTLLLRHHAFLA